MQQDLASLRAENRLLRTPGIPQVVRAPQQAAFTTTKVPQFGGTTSFSTPSCIRNGWDNDTAALKIVLTFGGGRVERGSSSATITSVI